MTSEGLIVTRQELTKAMVATLGLSKHNTDVIVSWIFDTAGLLVVRKDVFLKNAKTEFVCDACRQKFVEPLPLEHGTMSFCIYPNPPKEPNICTGKIQKIMWVRVPDELLEAKKL